MSEGSDHDYDAPRWRPQARDDVYSSGSSSSEAFQPRLRRRNIASRIGPTQAPRNTDHDYVVEPESVAPVRIASPDVIPVDEWVGDEQEQVEEEDDDDDDDDGDDDSDNSGSSLSTEASMRNSDHAYAEPMITPPPLRLSDEQVINALHEVLHAAIDTQMDPQEELPAPSTSALAEAEAEEVEGEIAEPTTPPPSKKRKRTSLTDAEGAQGGTPTVGSRKSEDDEDDGLTCPICLDTWEMSGPHRLVSLRCGHLFGDSCIRRWMTESLRQTAMRVCPQCKAKATPKDIRYLYAKRVRAIDRTEEHNLRAALKKEERHISSLKTDLATIKMSHALIMTKSEKLELENERLRETLSLAVSSGASVAFGSRYNSAAADPKFLPNYRLYMERNFEITKEPGCRVMVYSTQKSSLIASQKSVMSMFPGYGVRFIDVPTFKPVNFLHTSTQMVRDICLSASQQEIVVTSRETCCRLFDLRTRQVSTSFHCDDKPIWSCAMDRNLRENYLYLGDQRGSVNMYDIRNPDAVVTEFPCAEECTPAIRVVPVQANKAFPNGGFLVCMLKSLWFYEYTNDTTVPTRLGVQGPFMSLDYDATNESLLISTRSNQHHSQTSFILGTLQKINEVVLFTRQITFFGSKTSLVMTRANQISTGSNTLVVGYLQDIKQLVLYDAQREERVQAMPVSETVYDVCPLYLPGTIYLAALTDTKCRIYNVNSSAPT